MTFWFIISIMIFLAEIGILTFKIYQFTQKANKLYNYFIRSEKDLNGNPINFKIDSSEIPPINGGCPTKEELDNFEP